MIQLSKRLRIIADQVPEGSRLADIGSDHALLPTFLVQKGVTPLAIAGELNPGPYQAALKQVKEAGLAERIEVRQGDGLSVIQAGEVKTISIAGMGGSLISHILSDGASEGKLQGVKRLVLQPNVGEETVRRWLTENGFCLLGEHILEEDGKIYEVLWAEPAEDHPGRLEQLYEPRHLEGFGTITEPLLYLLGPYLLEQRTEVFFLKWSREIEKLERISSQLALSELEESKAKREVLLKEIQGLKELMECLQKARPLSN